MTEEFRRITIADCIAFAKAYKYGQFAHVYEAKYGASLVEVKK